MAPDDLPVIGPSAVRENLVHGFGFCGHGFRLAPLAGGIVAQLVLEGRTNRPIAAFAPDRFGAAARPAPARCRSPRDDAGPGRAPARAGGAPYP